MSTERKARGILLRYARHVADGAEVDWARAESDHEPLREKLELLRTVESIAAVHRTPLPADPPESAVSDPRETLPKPGGNGAPAPRGMEAWGGLVLKGRIGGGSFGEVYRAHDPSLQKDVALKLLRPNRCASEQDAAKFISEARRLGRVDHPNVLKVYGVAQHGGRIGLWTDLVEGETLEQIVRRQGPFSAKEAEIVGLSLCEALAAVHAAGILHRDVKTGNIMRRGSDGRIVLMDFSSASEKLNWDDPIRDDSVPGTPLLLAPEVLGGRQAEVAADIYAAGVVLYRLVTGRFPVEASNLEELREKHLKGERTPLLEHRPDLPASFRRIVERALDPDPRNRYAKISDLEADLRLDLGKPPVPSPWPRPTWIQGLAAAAVLLVAAVVLWMLLPAAPPLQARVDMYRRLSAGIDERLSEGASIFPGDSLFLEVEGGAPMHVYALNVDATGRVVSLFPYEGGDLENPLAAELKHRLPGLSGGNLQYWKLGPDAGPESFFVIAASAPLPEAERLLERAAELREKARAAPGQDRSDGASKPEEPGPTGDPDRGIAGVEPWGEEPLRPADPDLARILDGLLARADAEAGVWAWHLQIRNEGK